MPIELNSVLNSCVTLQANSQRASNTFKQVVEAKRFEGDFLCRKFAELKNQTLKKSAGTQKCYAQRNTPGVGNFSK